MTVPYAIPPTAVAGQPLAAADWNTKIRDSIESIARPPSCVCYRNTDQAVGNAVISNAVWLGAAAQTDAFWSAAAPSRITIPAGLGGTYLVTATPIFDINGVGGRYAAIMKNGLTVNNTVNSGGSASWYTQFQLTCPVICVPGDFLEIAVYQTSGGVLNLKGAAYMMLFTVTRLGV
jgi:hypothetical protein